MALFNSYVKLPEGTQSPTVGIDFIPPLGLFFEARFQQRVFNPLIHPDVGVVLRTQSLAGWFEGNFTEIYIYINIYIYILC